MTSEIKIRIQTRYNLSEDIRKIIIIILIFIFGIFNHQVFCQMQEISEKDSESLEEAEKIKSEAEQLQITANDLYLEAAMLEQSENFATDKKTQKEYKKKQQDAQKTELKAAEKFQEANKIQIDIYQKYINEFWKNFEGDESVLTNARLIEETSKEYFVRASTARDEAKRMDNQIEKFLKLSEAYEYELIGIEKLQTSYNIYKNWPDILDDETEDNQIDFQISDTQYEEDYLETSNDTILDIEYQEIKENKNLKPIQSENQESSNTSIIQDENINNLETEQVQTNQQADNNIQVNPDQVEKILRYMEEEDDTIYYLANEVEGFDMNSIHKFWNNYRNIEYEEGIEQPLLANEGAIDETSTSDISTEIKSEENKPTGNLQETTNQLANNNAESDQSNVEIGRVTETVVPDPNSKIIYRIQIAAKKSPLSQNMLQKLFYAKHKIAMVDEGGWYKYSIGEFDTFEEADEFRKTLNRDDAFVVAYRDAMNVQYVEVTETKNTTSGVVMAKKRPEVQSENITFVVQIAASRKSMDNASLKRIYKGELPIKSRVEDNWYKYQIGHTNSYLEIKEVKNNLDVHGAFIVAYDGDEKLKLWQAIRKVHSSNGQTIFVLQIAASKTKLSDEKINSIFSGNDHVIEIYEEGWYKYHIVCGNTYDAARRFKNLWGIKNSFIVAYKNNKKIDIRQAIKETSN